MEPWLDLGCCDLVTFSTKILFVLLLFRRQGFLHGLERPICIRLAGGLLVIFRAHPILPESFAFLLSS